MNIIRVYNIVMISAFVLNLFALLTKARRRRGLMQEQLVKVHFTRTGIVGYALLVLAFLASVIVPAAAPELPPELDISPLELTICINVSAMGVLVVADVICAMLGYPWGKKVVVGK